MGISDPYKNLMTKDIYAILDGDESYGEYESRSGKRSVLLYHICLGQSYVISLLNSGNPLIMSGVEVALPDGPMLKKYWITALETEHVQRFYGFFSHAHSFKMLFGDLILMRLRIHIKNQ